MHEISLVRSIFRTLDEQFSAAEREKITAINLKIGPLANVEPILLQNAFEAVLEEGGSPYQQARLQIEQVPIMVRCPSCGADTEVQNYRFVCAACGTPSAQVVQGNELLIQGVELGD